MKSVFAIILLTFGIGGLCVGTYVTTGGAPLGWAAIVAGGASSASAYVLMRPARRDDDKENT